MIDRFIQILDVFKSAGGPITASEIARRTEIPMPSAHRLVAELVRNDVLVKDNKGRLSMGIRLWEIAAMSSTVRQLHEAAIPQMQLLMNQVQLPVLLSVLDGDSVVNVETLTPDGPHPGNITRPGVRLPALASSSGIALMAFGNQDASQQILENGRLTRFSQYTPMDRTELSQLVELTKRTGYIVVRRWMWVDSGAVAVPIMGPGSTAIGSLSLTIPWDCRETARLASLLTSASQAIGTRMNGSALPVDPHLRSLTSQVKRATGQQK